MTVLDSTTLSRWRNDRSPSSRRCCTIPRPASRSCCCLPRSRSCSTRSRSMTTVACSIPELVYGAPKKSGKTTLAAHHRAGDGVVAQRCAASAKRFCVANDFDQAAVARLHGDQAHCRGVAAVEGRGEDHGRQDHLSGVRCDHHGDRERRGVRGWRQPVHRCVRRIVGLHRRACDAAVGRNDHLACAEDQLPADDDLCGLHRRERAAGGRCTSAAWRCRRSGRACVRATACCARGTPSRSRRGRTSAGWRRCGAVLRPSAFARMILNEFVSPESKFVDLSAWDACVQPSLTPVLRDRGLPIWVGVDAVDQARQHRAGGGDL